MHKAPLYIYIYICVRGSLCRSLFLSLSITHIHTLSVSHPVSVCVRARDPDASLAVSLCGRAILTDADGQVKAYAESPQFRAGIRARNRFSALGVGGASAGGNLFRGGVVGADAFAFGASTLRGFVAGCHRQAMAVQGFLDRCVIRYICMCVCI